MFMEIVKQEDGKNIIEIQMKWNVEAASTYVHISEHIELTRFVLIPLVRDKLKKSN